MKKVLAIAVLAMFAASAAFAQGIGVGYESNLGSTHGVSVLVPAGPVSVQGVLGFENVSPDVGDSMTELDIAGYVAYPLMDMGDARLSGFVGVAVETLTDFDAGYGVRFGIQPCTMITDNIDLRAKVGLQYMQDKLYQDATGDPDTSLGTFGSIGVHWIFQ